jgi:ubiquinone/menaquinone biosynthesis C-methylase UbiE
MKVDKFYEKEEVIHEVVEAKRSELCYDLLINLIAKDMNSGKRKRILDVGCGDGSFIRKFKDYCEVFGVDISWNAVKKARDAGINAYRVDVSSEKLPFEDRHFDIVYMGDVIEHLVNPDFAIREVRRVLKPEGFLVLSTPNLACWYNRVFLLLGIQPMFSEVSTVKIFGRPGTLPVGHLRLFTLKALKEFLNYYGFEIIKIKGAPFEKLPILLKYCDTIFSKMVSLSSTIIIVAK